MHPDKYRLRWPKIADYADRAVRFIFPRRSLGFHYVDTKGNSSNLASESQSWAFLTAPSVNGYE